MKIIVIISGAFQKSYQETGSRRLWRKLCMERDLCATRGAIVQIKEYNSDWKKYAEYINSRNPPEVLVCCYSWGAGFGMPQLSKRLQCDVSAVVCDPVHHSKTIWTRWMALFNKSIKLPKNVSVVGWISQKANTPGGDKLKGGKSICPEHRINLKHTEMDDSEEYHQLAAMAAKNYLQG